MFRVRVGTGEITDNYVRYTSRIFFALKLSEGQACLQRQRVPLSWSMLGELERVLLSTKVLVGK